MVFNMYPSQRNGNRSLAVVRCAVCPLIVGVAWLSLCPYRLAAFQQAEPVTETIAAPVEPASVTDTDALVAAESVEGNPPQAVPPVTAESPEDWSHVSELMLPISAEPAALAAVDVPGSVFAASQNALRDLRVLDAAGVAQPFALQVLAPANVRQPIETRRFDASVSEAGVHEWTMQLTGDFIDHNEITLSTPGSNFRRKVVLQRSDDGTVWQPLTSGYLVRFDSGDTPFERKSLSYSASRARFVKVQIFPDPEKARDQTAESFQVDAVEVLHTVQLTGRRSEYPTTLSQREPTRQHGATASAWIVDLGQANIPCDQIEFQVANREFVRDVVLQIEDTVDRLGQPAFRDEYTIERQTWSRSVGQPQQPLIVRFPESTAKRYRVIMYDYQNVPLTVTGAVASGVTRQLVVPLPSVTQSPASEAIAQTWRLYAGNPFADSPQYDFARGLPAKLSPQPLPATISDAAANPVYVAPLQPFSQRHPWAIYIVLTAACGLLLAIIFGLANRALAVQTA